MHLENSSKTTLKLHSTQKVSETKREQVRPARGAEHQRCQADSRLDQLDFHLRRRRFGVERLDREGRLLFGVGSLVWGRK